MLARKQHPEQFFPGKSLCDWRRVPDPGKCARKKSSSPTTASKSRNLGKLGWLWWLCSAPEALTGLGTCWEILGLKSTAALAKCRLSHMKGMFPPRVLFPKGKERFRSVFRAGVGSVQSWEFALLPDPEMWLLLESATIFTRSSTRSWQ